MSRKGVGATGPSLAGQGSIPVWPLLGPGSRCWVTLPPPSGHLAFRGVSSVWRRVLGPVCPIPLPSSGSFLLGKGLEGQQLDRERPPGVRKGSSRDCAEPHTAGECPAPECLGKGLERRSEIGGPQWPSFSPPWAFLLQS